MFAFSDNIFLDLIILLSVIMLLVNLDNLIMWKRKFKKNYARRSRVAVLWISEKKMKKYPDRKNVDREIVFFVNLCFFFYKMTKYQRQNAIEGDLFLVVDFRIF